MMRGIAKVAAKHDIPCQVSLEKRMACGLGACLSCVCDTANAERKKICKDGPVFWAQDVFFAH
jgi:dihydroorotate dehydrogenase electron transfer subunit